MRILCLADIHFRETNPECRTDDYELTLFRKLGWALTHPMHHAVVIAGDIFDKSNPPLYLVTSVLRCFCEEMPDYQHRWWCVAGQHDLPRHSMKLFGDCALALLEEVGRVSMLRWVQAGKNLRVVGKSYGESLPPEEGTVLVTHEFVYHGKKPWEECPESSKAFKVMDKYKDFKIIISGDNHQSFVVKHPRREQVLINPGSLMRMRADQIHHKPTVYVVDTETLEVEGYRVPIRKDVVIRDHIDVKKMRDKRIDAFVESLDEDYEISLSFKKNLVRFIEQNLVHKKTQEIIWSSVDGE